MKVDVKGALAALGIEYRDRGGGDLWACCPHPGHDEKDASWHIAVDSGVQHCFGCGRVGDTVDLVASVIGCTIGGALEWLREKKLLEQRALKTTLGTVARFTASKKVLKTRLQEAEHAFDDVLEELKK